jgi:hypothetical protein
MLNPITKQDVIAVARLLNQSLSDRDISMVMDMYPSEQSKDPDAEWHLIVENCIYSII